MKKLLAFLFVMLFAISFICAEELAVQEPLEKIEVPIDAKPILEDKAGWSIDNIQQFTKEVDMPYGKVSVKNSFLWFLPTDTIEDIELKSNTNTCGETCSAEKEITIYTDTKLVDSVRFLKLQEDGSWKEDNIRSYQFYLRTEHNLVEVPYTYTECTETGIILKNGTSEVSCKEIKATKEEYQDAWVPYNYEVMPEGNYYLKLEGNKKPEWTYDWLITTQGKEISEWSIWGSGINPNNITSYVNQTYSDAELNGNNEGARIIPQYDMNLRRIDLATPMALPINISIQNDSGTELYRMKGWANAGGNCNYFNVSFNLSANTPYRLVVYSQGSYTHQRNSSFAPFINNSVNWTGSIYNSVYNATEIRRITNITISQGYSTVTLNSPVNYYNTTSLTNSFNGTVSITGGATVKNVSFYKNNVFNQSINFVEDGLVAYYKLNDNASTQTVIDSSGNGNTGTLINAGNTTNVSTLGKVNNAFNFDGVNDYVNYTNLINMNLANNYTFSLWAYPILLNSSAGVQLLSLPNFTGLPASHYISLRDNAGQLNPQFRFIAVATDCDKTARATINLSNYNNWIYLTAIKNLTDISLYVNGVLSVVTSINTSICQGNISSWGTSKLRTYIGSISGASNFYNGSIDEVRIYNRSLSSSEVSQLYQMGLANHESKIISTTENFTYVSSGDESYNWSIQGCDSDGVCGFSENRTLTVDTTYPVLSISYPTGIINGLTNGQSLALNFSASDLHLSSCWKDYNGINTTMNCLANSTLTYASGINSVKVWANDTFGWITEASSNWQQLLLVNNISYNPITYESQSEEILASVTYNSSAYTSIYAILTYNGTNQTIYTSQTGDNIIFNATKIIPAVAETQNLSFYWTFVLNDGVTTYISSPTFNQTVNKLTGITFGSSCGAGLNTAFNFNFKDEISLIPQVANVSYNLKYGYSGNTSAVVVAGNISNITNLAICINSSFPYFSTGYGEIQYSSAGYVDRRFYIFDNTRLTNTTINNTLYLLQSAYATSFLFTAQDNQLINYVSKYLSLLRWYPGLNSYNTVEMAKTDDKGQTVMRVKTEDVDYRIGVYDTDGTLIKLLDPIRMACTSSPCTYTVFVIPTVYDYTSGFNIQGNLSYNNNTRIFSYIWNDPSQLTHAMNLTIWKDSGLSSNVVCTSTGSGYTGALSCAIGNSSGNFRAVVYRSASPFKPLDSLIIEIRNGLASLASGNGKTVGLFLTVLVVTTMALIGVFSPIAAMILAFVGLIPAIFLGSLNLMVGIGIGILIFIVFHTIRRTGNG